MELLISWPTIVVGDRKDPFSIPTTPSCRGGRYSIPWIAPLIPWSVPYNPELSKEAFKYHFLSLWYDSTWDWTPVFFETLVNSLNHGMTLGWWIGIMVSVFPARAVPSPKPQCNSYRKREASGHPRQRSANLFWIISIR